MLIKDLQIDNIKKSDSVLNNVFWITEFGYKDDDIKKIVLQHNIVIMSKNALQYIPVYFNGTEYNVGCGSS
jgi:hypothetical protein